LGDAGLGGIFTVQDVMASAGGPASLKSDAGYLLPKIESSVLDPANVNQIVGVDNAFVAHAGNLRVVFEKEGESVVITSVITRGRWRSPILTTMNSG